MDAKRPTGDRVGGSTNGVSVVAKLGANVDSCSHYQQHLQYASAEMEASAALKIPSFCVGDAGSGIVFMLVSDRPRPGLNLVDLNATIRNNATSNCSALC